jgi:hypothetical protein
MAPIFIDSDPYNADWTKQTWDLPPTNIGELRLFLREYEYSVAHFKSLPVYYMNVDKLPWLKDL